MVFGTGVKNIQAAAYNGARTVIRKKQKRAHRDLSSFIVARDCVYLQYDKNTLKLVHRPIRLYDKFISLICILGSKYFLYI